MQTERKQDIRSWAAIPAHKSQLTGQIYEPGKNWEFGLGKMIQSIRRELRSVVEVVDLHWLANPAWRADKRRLAILAWVKAIEAKGGRIRELSTGHETPDDKADMLMRAYEKASGVRSALNGTKGGRPRRPVTDHEKVVQEGVWHSRRYKNNDERVTAIKKRLGWSFGATELRKRYGPPGGQEAANA